jgi:predicted anti-sigma-YlaC factor YlaD
MSRLVFVAVCAVAVAGCSIKQMAVNTIADSLAEGGGVYETDDDPELIREALPFGLKTYESLLQVSPEHRGLLQATAKGFVVYAYLQQLEADRLEATDIARARALRDRASRLFLRGRDYALRGLEVAHKGLTAAMRQDAGAALAPATKEDAGLLYWAGAGWAAALAADKDNASLIAELPAAAALMNRVIALDEGYDGGAAHEFFISYEGSRPGGDLDAARAHYRRAIELSKGLRASTYVALAEAVDVREQNTGEFRSLLAAALAIDPDAAPELRLANTIAQDRARWLETRIPDLFVDAGAAEPSS